MDPSLYDGQRRRTRAMVAREKAACAAEKGATNRDSTAGTDPISLDAGAKGLGVNSGMGDNCCINNENGTREAIEAHTSQDAGERRRTRASSRPGFDMVARESQDAGERRRTCTSNKPGLDMVARNKGVCVVEKGATEGESALSTSNMHDVKRDPIAMYAGEKRPNVDNAMDDEGCIKNENGTRKAREAQTQGNEDDMNCYRLEPIGFEEKRPFILPGSLFRKFLPHQVEGVEWLWGIHCQYPGAILADDMGLGKTFQAAVFLSGLLRSSIVKRAILIVPVSVLDQWRDELTLVGVEDFVQIYHDCDDTGLKTVIKHGGILLTTYETYASKHKKLTGSSKSSWDYAILDEAHRIKNLKSQITGFMNKIHSKKKILLTGTPIQKDLMDLYSLLNFISPGLLGDVATFRKKYLRPVSLGKYENATETQKEEYISSIEDVRNATSTYVLRREKKVLIESGHLICKKHDMVVWLRLTNLQTMLYRKLDKICSIIDAPKGVLTMIKVTIWQGICNSPEVSFDVQIQGDNEEETILKSVKRKLFHSLGAETLGAKHNSCKAVFVADLVKEIFEEEKKEKDEEEKSKEHKNKKEQRKVRKILIFSRSLKMLDLIQRCLHEIVEDDEIIRIDGSVKRDGRDGLIKRFKSNDGPRVFLLSARVGGEGLNLTAATRVVIVDPSWNSSDDDQISDRVFRMGQTENVFIYRLVTCRTVEEHAYKTQLLKGALGRGITEGVTCASSVQKKEGKVLCLPDLKVGFNSSETHQLLEHTKANKLDFAGPHLEFLTNHQFVSGITNQKFVLSKEETSLSELPRDESDELSDAEIIEEEKKERYVQLSVTSTHLNKRNTAMLKQKVPTNSIQVRNTSDVSHIMEIPDNKVGLLIGTDGHMIRKIRLFSSTQILVENPRVPRSFQRSVKIVGTIEGIEKAEKMITDAIFEVDKEEEYLYVPANKVGAVIGSEGRTVKDINQKSGAYVRFVDHTKGFRLTGRKQQIDCAREIIQKIIDKTEAKLAEPQGKYVAVPETKIGLVIGMKHRTINEIKQISGAFVQFIDRQNGFLLSGNTQQIDSAEALISEIINKPCRRGSGHPQHGGHMPTSGVVIAGSDGPQPREKPSQPVATMFNRSEYYGERGSPEQRYYTRSTLRK